MHATHVMIGAIAMALAQQPAAPAADLPVSIEHVRDGLEKPPSKLTLTLKDYTPDFRVSIEQRRLLQEIFDTPPWQLDPIGWRPSGVGFDLMSLVRYVAKQAADAKRGHDEQRARDDVQQAIAGYCAAQPNRGTILICSNR